MKRVFFRVTANELRTFAFGARWSTFVRYAVLKQDRIEDIEAEHPLCIQRWTQIGPCPIGSVRSLVINTQSAEISSLLVDSMSLTCKR